MTSFIPLSLKNEIYPNWLIATKVEEMIMAFMLLNHQKLITSLFQWDNFCIDVLMHLNHKLTRNGAISPGKQFGTHAISWHTIFTDQLQQYHPFACK